MFALNGHLVAGHCTQLGAPDDDGNVLASALQEQAFMQELPIQEEKLQHWQEQVKVMSCPGPLGVHVC